MRILSGFPLHIAFLLAAPLSGGKWVLPICRVFGFFLKCSLPLMLLLDRGKILILAVAGECLKALDPLCAEPEI